MSGLENSVQQVWESGMCSGCGICAAVCPKGAVTHGLYEDGSCGPHINDNCVNCGICKKNCPQTHRLLEESEDTEKNAESAGRALSCYLVKSSNKEILRNGTSGGFVTTLVAALLESGEYLSAFCVDAENYSGVVNSRRIKKGEALFTAQKSRYVQVAHTDEIKYILEHREERVILVGTPCYLQGFGRVVEQYGLDRNNYLLVGLFCDRTMTARVWDYFDRIFAGGKLQGIHFRSKEKGGWPGDVKLICSDGEKMISRRERMDVKDYFMPEACIYCADKLNREADFAVGDDYVTAGKDPEGANTVILRTPRAQEIWNRVKELFEYSDCSMEQIATSQHLEKRRKNDLYRNLKKQILQGKVVENDSVYADYEALLKKISLGAEGKYEEIYSEILRQRKKKSGIAYRIFRRLKRRLGRH